ncbi:MAG TPA: TIM-barrel domain-containing protein [Pyrinomonadaceae bacterium]|jgi:alpha-D-xyloside xylohydrolase|nr:TIM-barrel domain-containing protein [Pyrinomonadaceae bacterium]
MLVRSFIRVGIVSLFIVGSSLAWATDQSRFAVKELRRDSKGVTFRTVNGTVRVEVCGDRVIHVVATPTSQIPEPRVPIVTQPCRASNFHAKAEKGEFKISTVSLTVKINAATGAVIFLSKDGSTLLSEPSGGGKSFDVPSVSGASIWQVQQSFLSPAEEALYGLGQHQEGIFDLRGVPIRLHQANTNISIPFLLSSKGYGLLWNNASLTDFNPADQAITVNQDTGRGKFKTGATGVYGFVLTSDNRNRLELEVNAQSVIKLNNEWMPTTATGFMPLEGNKEYEVSARGGKGVQLAFRNPQDTTTFRSEVGQAIDYYFFYGPELTHVISDYRRLTGQAPLFPKWAYGFWQCRERYHSQREILDTAAEFRKRQIPVDVLVQDWLYWGKYGWNALKFDEERYPRPKEMLDELHAHNLHMMISVWSKFGENTDVYKRMAASSLLIPGDSWMDFFNPQAQTTFWSELKKSMFDIGVDGWWMDASEPEYDALKDKETFLGSGNSLRNAYPLYVTKAIYEGQRTTTDRKRVVILTRSAFAGQQRYAAASWSGDISANWVTLKRQIPAGLSFSMSGIPYWSTDVGGFFRPKDQYMSKAYHELLIRWFEYGAFCPIFRVHGYQSQAELWNYGPEVELILRRYDELRYRLLPYIYSAAWAVTKKGDTLMRALPLEFSGDPVARRVSDQFMFGPALLISPVTAEGATKRMVYLPGHSDWIDYWTGKRVSAGQSINAEAPLDRIPIYVTAGSIIPFGPPAQVTSAKPDPIDLHVYRGANGEFTLYEDEGDNYDYERGAYSEIPIHWNDKTSVIKIGDRRGSFPSMLKHRTFHVVIVTANANNGIALHLDYNATIEYEGKAISLPVRPSR